MFWCSSALCDVVDVFAFVEYYMFSLALWCTQPIAHLFHYAQDEEQPQSWWLWGDFVNGNVSLALMCVLLFLALKILHWFLKKRWHVYRQLPTENRQLYVLANLCKASCLAVLFFSKIWITDVYDAFALDQWDTMGTRRLMRIKHISALYVATDVVALYLVPKLPTTTVIHHYVSWLLAMIIFGTDVRTPQSNVVRMILLYGAWSTVPYAVNAFLALRRLYEEVDDNGNAIAAVAKKEKNGGASGKKKGAEKGKESGAEKGAEKAKIDVLQKDLISISANWGLTQIQIQDLESVIKAMGEKNQHDLLLKCKDEAKDAISSPSSPSPPSESDKECNSTFVKTAAADSTVFRSVENQEKPINKLFWLEALAIFALVLYAATCACNWAWHLHWLIEQIAGGIDNWYTAYNASLFAYFCETTLAEWFPTIAVVLYSLSSTMLARDDVILMQWLWERALSNGCVKFVAETVAMTRTVAWDACKSLYSRPLKHIVAEKTE